MTEKIECFSCGALCPDIEGPTHNYMLSTPGCWAVYGEVLAREYSDMNYFKVHQLTVDSYACQHPGEPKRETINSVGIHLCALYLYFEERVKLFEIPAFRKRISDNNKELGILEWLEPPSGLGALTVSDVREAKTAEEHRKLVRLWAESVWTAWSGYEPKVEKWIDLLAK